MMRKLIVVILVVACVFVGMIVYRNISIKNNTITIQEIEEIENNINQIYMWKEITTDALPTFEEINKAPDEWVWEVVNKNSEEDILSREQIQEKAKELFGQKFNKEFPQEGTTYWKKDEETGKYQAIEANLDQQVDLFMLEKIEKIKNGYEVEIIEFLEDDSPMLKEQPEDYILIKNLKGEEIGKISGTSEDEEIQFVKQNKDKFSNKVVILNKQNGKLYIESVK